MHVLYANYYSRNLRSIKYDREDNSVLITFGKYEGKRIVEVPTDYLEWMIRAEARQYKDAQEELKRRGTRVRSNINVSIHAVDRASLRLLEVWQDDDVEQKGILTWLYRFAEEALKKGRSTIAQDKKRVLYKDVVFIFDLNEDHPTLVTVNLYEKSRMSRSAREAYESLDTEIF